MSTEAYRRHLARACSELRAIVGEILVQVPREMKANPGLDPVRRLARSEVAEALGRYPGPCVSGFGEALEALVAEAQSGPRSVRLDLDSLSIMDDLRAQEEIEVVQAGRLLADDAGTPLHRLQRLEAVLQARTEVDRLGPSPVGPAAVGRALWRATEHLPLSADSRSEAVRCMARLLGQRLGALYASLVEVAERDEHVSIEAEASAARHAAAPAAPTAPTRGRSRSPEVVAARRAAIAAERWHRGPQQDDFDVTRPGALVQLMDSRAMALAAASAKSRQPGGAGDRLAPAVAGQLDADAPPAAVHLFIGSIFDQIVSDPALDPEGADWIGRLQGAVLRMAAHDPGLLQSHRHPAWELVNQLATLFDDEPSQRPPNLDAWLERVMAMLRADPRRERFEAVNRKLQSWRADRARRRLVTMEPSVELLRRHAQLQEGVESARRRLERRLDASRADEAVRRFVFSVWALVCAQEDADGAPGAAGQPNAWDTATDLIWSASPARSRLDSPTLVSMIPDLVERLQEGMGRLGLDQGVQQAWLKRFEALHVRSMQRSAEDAQTDMPLTIDLELEDELPSADAPVAEPFVLHGLPSPADPLAELAIGDSLAIQIQGGWEDVSLIWLSDNGHFLLLARPDGRSLSVTRSSLRRLLDEGLARTPDKASVLARATHRIADGAA
jgi:hypothetical protein